MIKYVSIDPFTKNRKITTKIKTRLSLINLKIFETDAPKEAVYSPTAVIYSDVSLNIKSE